MCATLRFVFLMDSTTWVVILGRRRGWDDYFNMHFSIVLLARHFCLAQADIHHRTSPTFWPPGSMSLYINEILQHQSLAISRKVAPWVLCRSNIFPNTRGDGAPLWSSSPWQAGWPVALSATTLLCNHCSHLILLQLNSTKNHSDKLAPMKTGWEEAKFTTHLSS